MAYREQDAERARLAERERQVAGWLRTIEATPGQRIGRPRRSLGLWLLVLAGPLVGAGLASFVALVCSVQDRLAVSVIGGIAGFVAAVVVGYRVALGRRDGLDP